MANDQTCSPKIFSYIGYEAISQKYGTINLHVRFTNDSGQ